MDKPAEEISNIVKMLCSPASPEIQKATLERYFTSDAGFQHPICTVMRGPGSRDKILGIFQWYKIMAPHIDISVDDIAYDEPAHKLYLTISQTMHFWFMPLKAKPGRLMTVLELTPTAPHLITYQTDYYQPEEMASLILPPLSPLVTLLKQAATFVSCLNARIGQTVFGLWTTQDGTKKKN